MKRAQVRSAGTNRLITGFQVRISIALGTYNGQRFLGEQLDSLRRQTLLPCEVVISDDGSSDGTWEIIERFRGEAPFPVRAQRNKENLGWQENFVRTALRCEGQWVAFCDQDDVWLPEKLERVAACIRQHPNVVMVVHSAALALENLELSGGKLPDIRKFSVVERLHSQPLITQLGFATCFKRELLEEVPVELRPCDPNIPERKQSHDQLITLLANATGAVAYLPEVLAIYRRHGTAATGQAGTGLHERSLRARARGILDAGSERYDFQARIAHSNAAFLRAVQSRQSGLKSAVNLRQYESAVEFYDSLGVWLERRSVLYRTDQSARQRVRLLASAVAAGVYRKIGEGRGLGWKALAKDAAITALAPLTNVSRRRARRASKS